jgi:AcrR family transcriptional regulator
MNRKRLTTHVIRGEAQQRAVVSPLRLEIMGQFANGQPLSVKEIAERMGRPATAIHYHVGLLERSGLLKKTGERRAGRRREALYLPVADIIAVPGTTEAADDSERAVSLKAMASAFRMVERDMKAALADPKTRTKGKHRNFFGTRAHCRMNRDDLAELNRHLDAIQKMLGEACRRNAPSDDDEFFSLTLALMPLPDRSAKS